MGHSAERDVALSPITLGEDDVVQVVLLKPTFDWIQEQIRARGLYLFPIPIGDDDLSTYGVGVGQRLWTRLTPPAEPGEGE